MSAFAYYSPLWIGALLCAGVLAADPGRLPQEHRSAAFVLACAVVGVYCQLALVGWQGASARVLPVPGGRSIRGRGAVVTGGLLLLAVASAAAVVLIGFQEWPAGARAALLTSAVLSASALGSYLWCLPTAVRDFDRS